MSIGVLIAVATQDFRHRAIWWGWIPLALLCFLLVASSSVSPGTVFQYSLFNLSFLLFQFAILVGWFSLKEKKLVNITDRYIGLGDLLFIIPVTVLFSPAWFILFFTISNLVGLIIYASYMKIKKQNNKSFPLAGWWAICLIATLLTAPLSGIDRYNDLTILNLM